MQTETRHYIFFDDNGSDKDLLHVVNNYLKEKSPAAVRTASPSFSSSAQR